MASTSALVRASYLATHCCRAEENGQRQRRRHAPARMYLGTILHDLEKPLDFLRKIRKQQVKVDVIRKPDTVVMCQECEEKSAVVKCQNCRDFFCQDCFNSTHATGKRRGHIVQDVEVIKTFDSKDSSESLLQNADEDEDLIWTLETDLGKLY